MPECRYGARSALRIAFLIAKVGLESEHHFLL